MLWFLLMLKLFEVVSGNKQAYTDEKYNLLPQYTHLDDYDQCLSGNNGLYCFGTFRIHPNQNDNQTYEFIKEYSTESLNFDRMIFHRGYCVTGCPFNSNATKRFEKCLRTMASKPLHPQFNLNLSLDASFNASLESLHYCQTQKKNAVLDTPSEIFILIIFLIILANLSGTFVDFTTKGKTRSKLWTSWSLRSNWKQLVGPFGSNPDMTSLAPLQIMRVVLMSTVILIHVVIIKTGSYLESPLWIEKMAKTPFMILGMKWTSVVQIFYALSNFLTAYNLLLLSKNQKIGLWMLPKQFFKRYFRIAPVHLLFVGFAGTLWPLISDGPIWSAKIESESAICRNKIWYHLLHIQNLVEPCNFCLPQTWSLAVDIQLNLVSLVVTLYLAQYNLPRLKILASLFVSSCALNAGLAYVYGWKPLILMIHEMNLADSFHQNINYVSHFYITPWGSLPSCLIGLLMAQIYFQMRQQGFQVYKNKWLRFIYRYSLPFLAVWISAGYFAQDLRSPLLLAMYLGIDRPAFCIFPCIWLFGVISGVRIYPGFRKLSRRIFMPLGRLSLSVLLVHWVIITTRLSSQSQPEQISWWHLIKEFLASWSLSYLFAVPITLLVELPMQNTFTFISSLRFKTFKEYKYVTNRSMKEIDTMVKED